MLLVRQSGAGSGFPTDKQLEEIPPGMEIVVLMATKDHVLIGVTMEGLKRLELVQTGERFRTGRSESRG